MTRRGFSLIELLMVISVLAILSALLLGGLMLLRERQKAAAATVLLGNIGLAITGYIADWSVLGDRVDAGGSDFCAAPARFLVVRPLAAKRSSYLDLLTSQALAEDGTPTELVSAAGIRDPFGNPVQVQVVHERAAPGSGPLDHIRRVALRCTRGTATEDDDLVYVFDAERDSWEWSRR